MKIYIHFFLVFISVFLINSCVNHIEPLDNIPDNCTGSFEVTIEIISEPACTAPDGSLHVSSTSSEPVIYSIDGVTYQESGTFEGLVADQYIAHVKTESGCIITSSISLNNTASTLAIDEVFTSESNCTSNSGSINISASGGIDLMYSLDGESAQTSNSFSNVAPGTYNVAVTDASGCVASSQAIVETEVISYINDVKPIITANCAISGCHNGSTGLPNWNDFATFQSKAATIKSRTTSGSMPPASRPDLTVNEIALIACWVDGGALDN